MWKSTDWIKSSSIRGKFGSVTHKTYVKYAGALSRTEGMIVRYIHATKTNNIKPLGRFTLRGSSEQEDAAAAFYKLLVEPEGASDLTRLRQVKHMLYDTLLRSARSSDKAIACPTDQMLFLASILPDGRYCLPTQLMSLGGALHLSFRCIFMHSARLHIENIDLYLPWHKNTSSSAPGSEGGNGHAGSSSSDENDNEDEDDDEDVDMDEETESEDETKVDNDTAIADGRDAGDWNINSDKFFY